MGIAVTGCGEDTHYAASPPKCGSNGGGIAGLPAPAPVWTHAQADAIYFAPRGADLDGDGRLEIIVTGGSEMPATGEVVALDGATGAVRWRATADTQLYSSPVFLDVTGDGVQDVFVGGRLEAFMAVDGASGDVLWRFEDTRALPEYYFYNFYTPFVIADQTGDGVPDLLVANGGGDGIRPGEARPPGHLAVLNAVDGTLVAVGVMPDHQETYMSPILLPDDGAPSPTILFGTRRRDVDRLALGDLAVQRARRRPERRADAGDGIGKGVIAPPALADLDRDGRLDIIVATFDGRLIALSGTTREFIWHQRFENTESYTTPVLGFFDGDEIPDVFAVFLHGVFPDYTSAERVLLSGRDGSVLWQETAGDFAMAGDVAVDLNGDGIDEVIFNANTINDPALAPAAQQQLYLVDSAARQARPWGAPLGAAAAGSPWVGDLDADGCLDLVVPGHSSAEGSNDGLVTRFRVAAPAPASIRWGGYFGTRFDSIVPDPR